MASVLFNPELITHTRISRCEDVIFGKDFFWQISRNIRTINTGVVAFKAHSTRTVYGFSMTQVNVSLVLVFFFYTDLPIKEQDKEVVVARNIDSLRLFFYQMNIIIYLNQISGNH